MERRYRVTCRVGDIKWMESVFATSAVKALAQTLKPFEALVADGKRVSAHVEPF